MSQTLERGIPMGSWSHAYHARERAVLEHPLYPVLYRKVARWEADKIRPIANRYRNGKRDFVLEWVDGALIHTPNYGKTLIRHDDCGPRDLLRDVYDFAEKLLLDVFPQPWPSKGDMLAAIVGPATAEVGARMKPRSLLGIFTVQRDGDDLLIVRLGADDVRYWVDRIPDQTDGNWTDQEILDAYFTSPYGVA